MKGFYHIWAWFSDQNHLEFRIKTISTIFRSPSAWMLHMKCLHLAQWFQRRSRLKVWTVDGRRTDDGGLPYYKLPRSLRLRGAKKGNFFFSVNTKNISSHVLKFHSCYALVKLLIFSKHSMKYIWYSLPKSKSILYLLYLI